MPVKAVPDPANGREQASSDDIPRWMHERDELVTQMRRDGTWQPMFGPMLQEVAEALRMAAKLREAAEEELFIKSARSGRSYIHPGVAAADVEVRRAALLLSRIASMAKPPAADEEPDEDDTPDALRELDAELTQFSPDPVEDARIRRQRAANQRIANAKGRRK
jgi:hypothetical protein